MFSLTPPRLRRELVAVVMAALTAVLTEVPTAAARTKCKSHLLFISTQTRNARYYVVSILSFDIAVA